MSTETQTQTQTETARNTTPGDATAVAAEVKRNLDPMFEKLDSVVGGIAADQAKLQKEQAKLQKELDELRAATGGDIAPPVVWYKNWKTYAGATGAVAAVGGGVALGLSVRRQNQRIGALEMPALPVDYSE